MVQKRQHLNRILGRVEIFSLSFGTMIGWGWLALGGTWIESAGLIGAILAFIIMAIMCIMVGCVYSELISAFPLAGGEVAFAYRGLGYAGSWLTGWTVSLAYVGVAAWEGIALSTAFEYLIPSEKYGYLWTIAGFDVYFSWAIVGILGAIVLTILNIIGVRPVAIFQIIVSLMMITAGVIYVLGGFAFGKVENIGPLFTDGKGIGMVLLMAPSMFIGFDMISKSGEEISMPLKSVVKVLIFSIGAVCIWYVFVIFSSALLAPADIRLSAVIPAAEAAAHGFNASIFSKVIIAGGICGIITSWNGFIVGSSRIIFAMGRAKMLPGIFGTVHSKFKTPVVSILFVGLICSLSPLLGKNSLLWLVDVSSFGTVLTYFLISVSYLMIRKKEPELRREYKMKRGDLIGIATAISTGILLFFYTPFSPIGLILSYEWSLIIGWLAIGVLLLIIMYITGSKDRLTEKERELRIFGEEYSRED